MVKMRDSQRLETLSSAAGLGLWANDVVLALDRVGRLDLREPLDVDALTEASEILDAAATRSEQPQANPNKGRALAATETAFDIVSSQLAPSANSDAVAHQLRQMSDVLAAIAAPARRETVDAHEFDRLIDFFSALGEHQLVASNSVLSSRKDSRAWTMPPAIPNSL